MASVERRAPPAPLPPSESNTGGAGAELGETLAGDHPPAGERPWIGAQSLRIGRYAVLSKLGEGGMGAVYSAYDEELDRRLAIKLVREHSPGDTMGDARMQREAQAMARLSHPNVVQVYDVGTHCGQVFIAMEFVRGSTLGEWQEGLDPAVLAERRQIIDMYIQAGRGLAAAHRCDLVHRDFKPDNVLVGQDGRARVLDFGLAAGARALDADRGGRAVTGGDEVRLSSSLTRTGSVLGTPAYMAPEQFLARPSDARTDQFSFCVALYGALYGELPFGGETFAARQAQVCGGEVLPAPVDAAVPLWLRAHLLRGLEPSPEDRHETMEALLEVLADDPELARARGLRRLSLIAGALALGLLIVVLTLAGWEAWDRHRTEVEAGEALAVMESRVVAREEVGDEAGAERIFNAFVRNPAYGGTEALALAWLHRAERESALSRHRQAIDAYAASYAVATSREHQVAALGALIRFSRERERWDGLVEAVATLEEYGEGSFTGPELIAARQIGAFIRRDFDGALALLGADSPREKHLHRLVEALASAHETSVRGVDITQHSPRGDGEYAFPIPGGRLLRTRADVELTAIATHSTALVQFQELPLEDGGHYIAHDPASGENVILRADAERLIEVSRLVDHPVATTLAADLNGDGRLGLYLGTGPYTRHLRELIPAAGAGGAWSVRSVAPEVDDRASDVNSLIAGDLDGDGVTELVVALGPWRAYELLVLRWDPEARELRTVTRHKLGNADAALVRRGAGPPEIAVWKNDDYTTPLVFPPEQPKGEAAGLHLYRLVDDRLEESAHYLAPPGVDVGYARLMVGDLDGDGLEELVVHDARESSPGEQVHTTLIFTDDPSDPGGALLRLPLAHTLPVDVRDLDGDGDSELIVRLDDDRLWVVGAGAQRLPRLDRRGDAPELDPGDAPEVFAEVWRRAADLAQMGLETPAAEAYADLASTTTDPRYAAKALLRAGQLYESLGRDERAGDYYARAARSPELAVEAAVAALRVNRGRGELDRSRALLDELVGEVGAESAATLRAARAELGDQEERGFVFDFSDPMDHRWRLHQPHALHRDAPRSSLRIDAVGGALAAALPVRVRDGLIVLEVELDLHRIEWGEALEVGLATGDSEAALQLGAAISGDGGQGDERINISCYALGVTNDVDVKYAAAVEARAFRYSVRVVVDRERAETSCTVRGAEDRELLYRRVPLVGRGGLPDVTELRIRGRSSKPIGWINAELHRLSSIGIEIREGEPLALGEARRALVEGHLDAGLRLLGEVGEGPGPASSDVMAWRLMALARLGRWAEAGEVVAPLVVGAAEEDFPPAPLVMLLRTMPETASGLLRAAGATELYQRWLIDTWGLVLRLRANDPLSLRVARLGLEGLDATSEVDPGVRSELFALRAAVYVGLGMDGEARDDFGRAIEHARAWAAGVGPEDRRRIQRAAITWSLRQASAAIRAGDLEGGRALVVALLAEPREEAFVRDMLRAWPEFRALGPDLEGL